MTGISRLPEQPRRLGAHPAARTTLPFSGRARGQRAYGTPATPTVSSTGERARASRRRGRQHPAAEDDARLDRRRRARPTARRRSSTISTSRSSSPGGTQTFLGNDFAAGVSTTGGAADTRQQRRDGPGEHAGGRRLDDPRARRRRSMSATRARATRSSRPATWPSRRSSTGVQDTLVVRVKFADIALRAVAGQSAEHDDRSRRLHQRGELWPGQRRAGVSGRDRPRSHKDYYYHPDRNLLIELTEEVVAKLVAAEPNVFDTIERMIIVTNDVNFTGDWATTGPWPYDLPAASRGRSPSPSSPTPTRWRASPTACCTVRAGRSLRPRRRDVPAAVRRRVGQHGRDSSTTCTRWSGRRSAPAG